MPELYFAGGCLWGVQEYMRHLPGVIFTEAGRANGLSSTTKGEYDGYAESVRIGFDLDLVTVGQLMDFFFEIIDPYSLNRQGADVGKKYRTGVYGDNNNHLREAKRYIENRDDADLIAVEVLPLSNYVKSADEHQDRLTRFPEDYCHIPKELLHRYKR
jgi:peptide-methionine (S)-S-oxide reductase